MLNVRLEDTRASAVVAAVLLLWRSEGEEISQDVHVAATVSPSGRRERDWISLTRNDVSLQNLPPSVFHSVFHRFLTLVYLRN